MLPWLLIGVGTAAALRRVFGAIPPAPSAVRTLSAREYQTVRAAAQVVYPRGGALPTSADEAGVPLHVDRFVGAQQRTHRWLMGLLFFAIEHGTLVFPAPAPRGWRRFSSLDADQQLAYLEGWSRSESATRRLVFTSLRAILTMGYFAAPEVLRALGLAPREIARPVLDVDLLWPAVGEHPSSIAFTPRDVTGPGEAEPLGPTGPLQAEYR